MSTEFKIIVFLFVLIAVVMAVALPSLMGRRLETFETVVVRKHEERSMLYTGVFIPVIYQYLVVELGVEVKVDKSVYDRMEVGDPVRVTRYSNGTYRMAKPDPYTY